MWYLKTTIMPVIVGALGMIKKGEKSTKFLAVPAYMKYKKLHFRTILKVNEGKTSTNRQEDKKTHNS